ncbi:MAG: hypothetical protein ACYDBB_16965 [Armatimonadota bacterium]
MHHLSPFEIGMLVCFGVSWPFSVYKTWKTKTSTGRSFVFLWLVLIGYISGVIHKLLFSLDFVIALYALNALLVTTDLLLCYHYRSRSVAQEMPPVLSKSVQP